jgi:hypothetical protein
MRKSVMLAVTTMFGLVGCGVPLTFDGNFTGLLVQSEACSGYSPDTYQREELWLIAENAQDKTLSINSDGDCDKLQGSYNGESATLGAVQCRTIQVGSGDTFAQRIDSGNLSLNADKDLVVSLSGSYVYTPSGYAPVNCTFTATGTLYRFE